MKQITILVPQLAVIEAVADPRYLFTAVNHFLAASGRSPAFAVELVSTQKEIRLENSVYSVHADKLLQEATPPDLVIIPALSGDMAAAVQANQQLIPWIKAQRERGAEVASLCLGAFLFASTGLLEGKKCSTHWGFANQFRTMFPDVELVDGYIITEEKGLYTSGGANSYWNLLLYLVEKYTDRATAILAAKYFAIDIERESQAPFTLFSGQKAHPDEQIRQAQDFIEAHYNDKFTVDELADRFAIGRRSFERRFKKATHNTIVEYMQRVKMEAAKRSFESSRKNINEVMYDVGYTDTKAFRTVFKKVTGLTPVEYRNKYSKEEWVK